MLRYYGEHGCQFAMWIMGFENTGARAKPIEFKEIQFMMDLPKPFFNKKLVIIIKRMQLWLHGEPDNPKGFIRVGPVYEIKALAYLPETKSVGNF